MKSTTTPTDDKRIVRPTMLKCININRMDCGRNVYMLYEVEYM